MKYSDAFSADISFNSLNNVVRLGLFFSLIKYRKGARRKRERERSTLFSSQYLEQSLDEWNSTKVGELIIKRINGKIGWMEIRNKP